MCAVVTNIVRVHSNFNQPCSWPHCIGIGTALVVSSVFY